MEPTTIFIIGAAYAGAQVAQHVADEVVTSTWGRVKTAYRNKFGTDPDADNLIASPFAELISDSGLSSELEAMVTEWSSLRRATMVHQVFQEAQILWVDDRPGYQFWERTLFTALGASVGSVQSNDEAIGACKTSPFDVVISDIDRFGEPLGLQLPGALEGISEAPIVFYVGRLEPGTPAGSFGITSHVDELIHLVCDVLERGRV